MYTPNSYNAFIAVTPDDFRSLVTLVHKKAWGVFIGVGGDISLTDSAGTEAIFKNVPSGTVLPIHVTEINNTGTTATNIIALFSIFRT